MEIKKVTRMMDSTTRLQRYLLAILSALFLSFAFPPYHLGFMAFFGLVPIFYLLEGVSPGLAFKWGYVWGLFFHIANLYWIGSITIAGVIGAILFLSLYFALFLYLAAIFREYLGNKAIIWYPFLWLFVEFIRSLGVLGFPWSSIGYTQTYYIDFIQFATITGVFGVSFWILWINICVYLLLKNWKSWRKSLLYGSLLALLIFLPWFYGKLTIPDKDEFKEKIDVAIIQGNIDPLAKWNEAFLARNFSIYEHLTHQALKDTTIDLAIWPETATACYLRSRPEYLERVRNMVDSSSVGLLTGTPDYKLFGNGSYKAYNAIFLILPNYRGIQYYYKRHLVPFGEKVPLSEHFPFLEKWLDALQTGVGDFAEGKDYNLFELPGTYLKQRGITEVKSSLLFAGVICYESIFQDEVRRFIKKGAKFLVIVTNDAWFGKTAAPYHHAQIAVFRAIENRVSVARCANTGVSMIIDPYGRVLTKTKLFKREIIKGPIVVRREKTFFTRHGDIFTYVVVGALCVEFIWVIIKARVAKRRASI